MNITADIVKQLRERTGAGMMECKKALVETKGDLDAAAELMRKSGLAKADKKAARVAAEGTVAVERAGLTAVLVEVNCETDFVARSDEFQAFAARCGQGGAWLIRAPSVEALLQTRCRRRHARGAAPRLVAKIGENIAVRRFVRVTAPGALGAYLHGTRIGALVALEGGDEALRAIWRCTSPRSIRPTWMRARCRAEVLDKEREILTEQTKGEKKPPEIIAKMVEGRLRKFLAEITLLGQPFVKDPDTTVEKLLKKSGAKVVAVRALRSGCGHREETGRFRRRSDGAGQGQDKPSPKRARYPIESHCRRPRARGVFYSRVRNHDGHNAHRALPQNLGQVVRRGAAGRARTTASIRRSSSASPAEIREICADGRAGGRGARRRQHFSRRGSRPRRHGSGHRRPHGHARHRDQCARDAGCAREPRHLCARHVGAAHQRGVRGLHPAPRRSPSGEGPGGDLRRRHRQSVLHDRYRGEPARDRDQRGHPAEGDQGQRRLRLRSAQESRTPSATRT